MTEYTRFSLVPLNVKQSIKQSDNYSIFYMTVNMNPFYETDLPNVDVGILSFFPFCKHFNKL